MTATVRNVSAGTDPPYVLDAFSSLKREMALVSAVTTGPYRWLDQELVFLVDAAGKMTSCGLPPQGSALRGGVELGLGGRLILVPKPVDGSGQLERLECIFPVPDQEQQHKLLVLGAAPIPVRLMGSGGTQ